MLTEVWPFVVRARRAGRPVVLARLVGRDGPGSRPLGATMAVAADGSWCGSVSGGCVEGMLLDVARTVLDDGGTRLVSISPGEQLLPWEPAPACAGLLTVLITPTPPASVCDEITSAIEAARPLAVGVSLTAPWSWTTAPSLALLPTSTPAVAGSAPALPAASRTAGAAPTDAADATDATDAGTVPVDARITPADATDTAIAPVNAIAPVDATDAAIAPVNATDAGIAINATDAAIAPVNTTDAGIAVDATDTAIAPVDAADAGAVFAEELRPGPRLIVVGGTDLAAALAALGRTTGRRVEIVDPRPSHARDDMFPGASLVVRAWPDEWLAAHPPSAADAVVAITHDPRIDDRALRAALPGPAGYVGALGSRATHAQRLDRLSGTRGLDRLRGPAGLDLGATSIAETALSVLAEIVAVAHHRTGGPLATSTAPIQAVRDPALATAPPAEPLPATCAR